MQHSTIRELQEKMSSGELTARSLAQSYLERIDALDKRGPAINAVIELNPDALAIADALDQERKAGKTRGPLHGVPILIKDNIDTHDRMQTTAGSLALEGAVALRDAFLVRRLRASGAVILGKANLSEWSYFRGKHAVSGWSSRGGLTRNPYALDRSASGSSSGSAAAVAAGYCPAAVGTDTDGSVISPSHTNGIVGIRPTLGLISRSGIIPIAHSQDTAGPMACTVEDAAILLGALAGADPRDQATRTTGKHVSKDYTKFLDRRGLEGARIGVARNMAGPDSRIIDILESSLDVMKKLGATIVDPANVPNYNKFAKSELEVLWFEFKEDMNRYLASRGPGVRVKTLADVIRFNEENRARVMPYFGQEQMITAQEKGPLSSRHYREALARSRRLARREGVDVTMRKYRLDAIVVPSGAPAWTIDLVNGDPVSWDIEIVPPSAVSGYPHITVPAGNLFGLPVGLSFFATAWQEPALLKLAYAFEQATKMRKSPRFLPSIDTSQQSFKPHAQHVERFDGSPPASPR